MTKRKFWVLVAFFVLVAGSTCFSADLVLTKTPVIAVKMSPKTMDPNWIIAKATVDVANATIAAATATKVAAGAAVLYAFITLLLIFEQRKSRLDDKFPCIVVRSRLDRAATAVVTDQNEWTIRLVNIGRGPAFIEYFCAEGLHGCSCADGDLTDNIDKVIGPDMGDPHLQVAFAQGDPLVLRRPELKIIIHYRDIAGRLFKSRLIAGKHEYERPPWYGSWLDSVFVFCRPKSLI